MALMLVLGMSVLCVWPVLAQNLEAARKPAARAPAAAPAEVQPKKVFHGRLPAYFGEVVDQKQRETIYAIQREYFEEIEALKTRLALVTDERDKKILMVLSPQQRDQVDQLKAQAKAKRAQK
jgi:hypothetical protein